MVVEDYIILLKITQYYIYYHFVIKHSLLYLIEAEFYSKFRHMITSGNERSDHMINQIFL
ncbi:hypothetical protein BpHYR1_026737 [Brachionus plicatilis]|uniref:Uncharacterized protein n=1 Tax=Brachionus plicatilis TaxID=10195 RepID=A0A3M7RFG1_BRAPC|nr:hypothetical protein BpHYR1_026737 [Brachionus plicatilis]